uniref:Uncharacterized protein n=1 Tax=Arundo donax TaxID=35708 RepID=A0A0A9CU19_ARUDO
MATANYGSNVLCNENAMNGACMPLKGLAIFVGKFYQSFFLG